MRNWWKTEKGKQCKKTIAARFNKTDKGRIVKKRLDDKYRSTINGHVRGRMLGRFRELMTSSVNHTSKRLSNYTTLCTKEAIEKWAAQFGTPEENLNKHIDHIIPVSAYAWKWERKYTVLVHCEISDEDLAKLWHPDNLALIEPLTNMRKGCYLPDRDVLLKLQKLWPSNWEGTMPCDEARRILGYAPKGKLRRLEFLESVP